MPSTKLFKNISHVIFDVDGLLLDTEILYEQVYKNIVERYGKIYKKEYQLKILGCQTDVINEFFVDHVELPITYQEFQDLKSTEMEKLFSSVELMPGSTYCEFSVTDTEKLYRKAISDIAKSFNKVYTPEIMNKIVGTPQTETCRIAIKEMNLPIGLEQFRKIFIKLSYANIQNVPLLPG